MQCFTTTFTVFASKTTKKKENVEENAKKETSANSKYILRTETTEIIGWEYKSDNKSALVKQGQFHDFFSQSETDEYLVIGSGRNDSLISTIATVYHQMLSFTVLALLSQYWHEKA